MPPLKPDVVGFYIEAKGCLAYVFEAKLHETPNPGQNDLTPDTLVAVGFCSGGHINKDDLVNGLALMSEQDRTEILTRISSETSSANQSKSTDR